MKKTAGLIVLIVILLFGTGVLAKEKFIIERESVEKFSIIAQTTSGYENEIHTYETTNSFEIDYIINTLNSLNYTEKEKQQLYWYSNRTAQTYRIYELTVTYNDGSKLKFHIVDEEIWDKNNLQYRYEHYGHGSWYDYRIFLILIQGLNEKQINLKSGISFERSEWSGKYINEAIERGLLSPMHQNDYTKNITRLEAVQLLYDLSNEYHRIAYDKPFNDIADKGVDVFYLLEIINGKESGKFYPFEFLTREEMAKIVGKNLEYEERENGFPNAVFDCELNYADTNEISDWAIDGVKAVTANNLMQGNEKGEFEPQKTITKEEFITMLLRLSNLKDSTQNKLFEDVFGFELPQNSKIVNYHYSDEDKDLYLAAKVLIQEEDLEDVRKLLQENFKNSPYYPEDITLKTTPISQNKAAYSWWVLKNLEDCDGIYHGIKDGKWLKSVEEWAFIHNDPWNFYYLYITHE